ncbi:TonB-dependent receptor [Aequorivita sp. SDUM287046]|uniref:TonB-dependent receptor n=1 Tax=Aequorivita aurantiaca TaxID=3053356 RepID=A0ABT8DEK1_9FLAO|nr:TonB-dependent receptor [Aequorivita aurantiaca]MDN3723736.1 TonB-dependent receptor [Aequorivita aurantiaca]
MEYNLLKAAWLVPCVALFNMLNAQEIEGYVYSATNIPLAGVSVYFQTEKVTLTDENGTFYLPEIYKLPIGLQLEHPDYYIAEVVMTSQNNSFKLTPMSKNENLDAIFLSSQSQIRNTGMGDGLIIPTEIITATKLNAYSPIDVVSAINETPGVYIQSGAINTNRITIRGVGSRTLYGTNKVRAYFNGFPVTNGVGETAIDVFDPENIALIEIIKGPKSTQYGTNLGGTLLLNTKEAPTNGFFVNTNFTVGSFGLLKNMVSTATSTEKFSLNVNYDYLKTNGFRENNKYERSTLLLTSKYKLNSKNEISILMNYIDYWAQIPSSISKSDFDDNPSQAAFTWKEARGYEANKQLWTGLSFAHSFSKNFGNTTSLFYSYLDHYEPRPFNILDEFTNSFGGRTVFTNDFKFRKQAIQLTFGGELYQDEYHWNTIENLYEQNNGNGSLEGNILSANFEKRKNLNLFATITIPFTNKLKGQFGLNFNTTQYSFIDEFNEGEANKTADRDFNPIWAPNVNLLYQFSENLNAFFNFSRGFNYPSIEETLTPDGIINPELGPEKGYNYEIGSKLLLLNKKLHFQVNAYLLDIDDLLVAQRTGNDQYIGRNAGKTEHKGIELQLSFLQPINGFGYISPYFNAEFSDHKFVDFIDGDSDFSENQLTGVPDKKFSGGINFGYKNLVLNTNFLDIGEVPLNDANAIYSEKYSVFNAKVAYTSEISRVFAVEINAGINNFTDEKYAASVLINATGFGNSEPRYFYPGMPRNWFGGIKLKFNF